MMITVPDGIDNGVVGERIQDAPQGPDVEDAGIRRPFPSHQICCVWCKNIQSAFFTQLLNESRVIVSDSGVLGRYGADKCDVTALLYGRTCDRRKTVNGF